MRYSFQVTWRVDGGGSKNCVLRAVTFMISSPSSHRLPFPNPYMFPGMKKIHPFEVEETFAVFNVPPVLFPARLWFGYRSAIPSSAVERRSCLYLSFVRLMYAFIFLQEAFVAPLNLKAGHRRSWLHLSLVGGGYHHSSSWCFGTSLCLE